MRKRKLRVSPSMAVAALALFLALGGSVYAAKRARMINGRAIRPGSIPGNRLRARSVPPNRLRPRSIPANRLRPGVLRGVRINKPLTGAEINELTLGQVPDAAHADSAEQARRADEAEVAQSAVEAARARTVNGHGAGCLPGTRPFAGACWEESPSAAVAAPEAARRCAERDGALPGALRLAAFAGEDGAHVSPGGEWSGDVTNVSALEVYAVASVSANGQIDRTASTNSLSYRCVIPLLK